jgi:hypothetical protein
MQLPRPYSTPACTGDIYVSNDDPTTITSLIDWQSSSIEPAFINADKIPDNSSSTARWEIPCWISGLRSCVTRYLLWVGAGDLRSRVDQHLQRTAPVHDEISAVGCSR